MAPSSRSRLRAAAVLGPMLVLVCCRGLVLRSAAHQLYAGEAAGVGRLQWALSQGTFEWHGPARFVVEHTYQYFAQGTAFLQVVAAALSPFFGHTFTAQAAAAIALEALGVGLFAWLLLRITAPAGAALGAVALALPPRFTATFALQPYGNHTEYLWVPLAAALILLGRSPASSRRSWRRGVAAGALLGLGVVLYRLNALPALALIAVLAARGGRASLGSAAAVAGVTGGVAALLFWPLGLSPLGWDPGGLGSFPADGPRWERAIDTLHFAWVRGLDGVRLGDDLGRTHRVLLLLGVLGAALSWMPARESSPPSPGADARVARRDIARFASLWAVLALAAPVLTGNGTPRYFIPAFAACTLSLASHLSSSRHGLQAVAGGALLALAVLGGREVTPLIDPGVWSREMPRHDLWFVLELDTLDADELPYYRRILTEGRGSPWVGRSSHHASNRCGRWPGTGPGHAPPDIDHCQGWGPGELATVVADVQRRTTEADRRRALMDLGRGAWIRSNRALAEVARAIEGTDPTLAEPVLAGARDEARRWQDR